MGSCRTENDRSTTRECKVIAALRTAAARACLLQTHSLLAAGSTTLTTSAHTSQGLPPQRHGEPRMKERQDLAVVL